MYFGLRRLASLFLLGTVGALAMPGWGGMLGASPARADELWIVVHKDNPLPGITLEALSQIFLGKSDVYPDGQKVIPVDQSEESPLFELFAGKVHGKDLNQMKSYWARRIFSGEGAPPRRLPSDEEVLKFIRENPKAVGYVKSRISLEGVRILPINGRESIP